MSGVVELQISDQTAGNERYKVKVQKKFSGICMERIKSINGYGRYVFSIFQNVPF